MKIAVLFDSKVKAGGGFFQSLRSAIILNKLEKYSNNFYFLTPDKETFLKLKDEDLKSVLLGNLISFKIFYQINKIGFFKIIFNFLKIKNPFVNFLKKNQFDLIIFLGPSWFIKITDNFNFISSIYDINFKLDNYFPEYKSQTVFESQDEIVGKSVDQAYKILVDTERSKNELIKIYNCTQNKIAIQPFTPLLPIIDSKINKDYSKIVIDLGLKDKKFLFYPAQFWAHKNHKYIIDAMEHLERKQIDINFVFCGTDKNNLKYIKKIISKKKLDHKFFIYNYLTDEKVIALYKFCIALVMPTYVARSTLPLYESFYFKKPVFYSRDVLDEDIESLVTPINLNNPKDLSNNIERMLSDPSNFNNKINLGFEYYNKKCSEDLFLDNYRKILDEYKYLSERWKN